jgi:hypothetical protein
VKPSRGGVRVDFTADFIDLSIFDDVDDTLE